MPVMPNDENRPLPVAGASPPPNIPIAPPPQNAPIAAIPQSYAEVCSLKLPGFWMSAPDSWFIQAEAQFDLTHIRSENTKYAHLLASLTPDALDKVIDVIRSPPEENRYTSLKHALMTRLSASEEQRIGKLLYNAEMGDSSPSEFHRRMTQLAASSTDVSESSLTADRKQVRKVFDYSIFDFIPPVPVFPTAWPLGLWYRNQVCPITYGMVLNRKPTKNPKPLEANTLEGNISSIRPGLTDAIAGDCCRRLTMPDTGWRCSRSQMFPHQSSLDTLIAYVRGLG
uniref:DUF7041 domain-containing protein n=1 Tax=Anopheles minimus TaxID=112268 RepID=A0A182W9I2_9DIPT